MAASSVVRRIRCTKWLRPNRACSLFPVALLVFPQTIAYPSMRMHAFAVAAVLLCSSAQSAEASCVFNGARGFCRGFCGNTRASSKQACTQGGMNARCCVWKGSGGHTPSPSPGPRSGGPTPSPSQGSGKLQVRAHDVRVIAKSRT